MEIQKSASTNRLRYIDIAKGIAIICIILGHLGNWTIVRIVFTFHVPIFFFITGYFTSDKRNLKEFIKVKFRTLIVPYILTCILIIILGTIKGYLNGDALASLKLWTYASLYGAGDYYSEPFQIIAIGALWFLWASFWGSIFLRLSLNFNKYLRIVFIIVLFLAGYYSRSICWFPLSIQAGACATLFMYLGYLVKDAKEVIKNIPQELKSVGIIFAFVTWFFFIKDFKSFWLVHCDVGRGIVDIFGCICACVAVLYISKFIDKKVKYLNSFLAYFGKYSLLVLCVHIIELNLFPWGALQLNLMFLALAKIIADLACVFVLSKINFVKKLYGIKD